MGYESKIYIGKVCEGFSEEHNGQRYKYVMPIVTIEMGCVYEMMENFAKVNNYYITVGNEDIYEDCYGEKLASCSLYKLHEWLLLAEKSEPNYRRYKLLASVLFSFLSNSNQWQDDNLIVLNYGH